MEELQIETLKEMLIVKERYYNENVRTYKGRVKKYIILIGVFFVLFLLDCLAVYKLNEIGENIEGSFEASVMYETMIVGNFTELRLAIVAVILVLLIRYYQYTHLRGEIRIGKLTLRKRNNFLSMLEEEKMDIYNLKNKIDYLEEKQQIK